MKEFPKTERGLLLKGVHLASCSYLLMTITAVYSSEMLRGVCRCQSALRQALSAHLHLQLSLSSELISRCKAVNFKCGITQNVHKTKTLITNKYTKRILSSIVTHSYKFRPCWVIFRENFFVTVTLRLHFIVEWECAVDCILRCFWRRELSGPQRVHASLCVCWWLVFLYNIVRGYGTH
jgi:hypothetical protein